MISTIMNYMKAYGDSILLLALAFAIFLFTRNDESLTLRDTRAVKGVLSESPDIVDIGEATHHVRFNLVGYNDQFDFVGCSFNSHVIESAKTLHEGDSVFLRTMSKSGSISWTWSGGSHDNFTIVQAWNPRVGYLIDVDQYNYCSERKSNYLLPFLCGVLALIGLGRGVRTWKDRERSLELKTMMKQGDVFGHTTSLKPDFTAYMIAKSPLSVMLIVVGIFSIYNREGHVPSMLDWCWLAGGILAQGWHMFAHRYVLYIVTPGEIEIRSLKFPFDKDTDPISYSKIKAVNYRQSIFEAGQNVGTVMIDLGETDDEGSKVYTKLIGIEHYKEVAALILKRVEG